MYTPSMTAVRRWAGVSRNWVTQFLDNAESDETIVALIAMGSAVRDRGHRRSDFDLVIIYRGKRSVAKAPIEVDVRLFAIEKIDEQVARGHEVLCWALQFGTAIYDPQGFWERLSQKWQGRIPFPSASDARQRAGQALDKAEEMLEAGDDSAADDLLLTALTQFARERLIRTRIFPASRPELPEQLRTLNPHDQLAALLEESMYGDSEPSELYERVAAIQFQSTR